MKTTIAFLRRLPLTLTLSRREREQPLAVFGNPNDCRAEASRSFAKELGAFLPLPTGEGRGEGKRGGLPIDASASILTATVF